MQSDDGCRVQRIGRGRLLSGIKSEIQEHGFRFRDVRGSILRVFRVSDKIVIGDIARPLYENRFYIDVAGGPDAGYV